MVLAATGSKKKVKLTLNDVRGPIRNKQGSEFWFATAETTPKEESIWKTLRWSKVFTNEEPPKDWKTGAEVEVRIRSIDYEKGTAVFDVKA